MSNLVTVTGDREIDRALEALPEKLQRKILRKGFRAGSKILLKGARKRFPKGSGLARTKLAVRAVKRSRRRIGVYLVYKDADELKVGEQEFFYPAAVEYGVESRNIPAQAPLRRTYDEDGPAARDASMKVIAEGIESEAAKQ